jgi:hypothetical protein
VSSTLDRPFSDRWVECDCVAVLVGQRPWNGPTSVVLLTWLPRGCLSDPDWTAFKGQAELSAYMKKRERKHEGSTTRSVVDPEFQLVYPTLYDYLTATCYDDDPKQPRVTSTLLVFGQDGCWKANLRDRSEGLCAWFAAPQFTELLGGLERELTDDHVVWRLDRAAGHELASRKPRGKGS